jgi:glycosyltransferase involved in cell wall biosynthesis
MTAQTSPDQSDLISVVVPTYNRAHLVHRAIQSVLSQTHSRLECLIVDDASTDNTSEIVGRISDPRVKYLRLPFNQGPCSARNHGIQASSGRYVAFLDSDDEWLPTKLDEQLAPFKADSSGTLGVVLCGLIKVTETLQRETSRRIPRLQERPYVDLLFLRERAVTSTMLIKRECFDGELWDERLAHRQDWDLSVRLAKTYSVLAVPKYLAKSYQHDGPRTSRPSTPWIGWEQCIAKYKADLLTYPKALARHHYFAFRAHYAAGSITGARRHLIQSVWYDPWHPGKWVVLADLVRGPQSAQTFANWYEAVRQVLRMVRGPEGGRRPRRLHV